jgi:acyl carrier protein phosphodiesterase
MNHLAHIHLSRHNPILLAGNFGADLLSFDFKKNAPDFVGKGIKLHLWIDAYTDNHPLIKEQKRKLYPDFGKYSPVLLDLLMDHQLACHWYLFNDEPFEESCDTFYAQIEGVIPHFPDPAAVRVRKMLHARWLHTFAHTEGFGITLQLFGRRTTFKSDFSALTPFYLENKDFFDRHFCEFYPELDAYARLRTEELS